MSLSISTRYIEEEKIIVKTFIAFLKSAGRNMKHETIALRI